MIQQPQQAGPYLSQQNVPLMVEVRPERQIENINNLTEEEKKLVNSLWCRYFVEMALLIYCTFWGLPCAFTYVVDGIFIMNVLLFANIKARKSPSYQAILVLFNSSRVTVYGTGAVVLFIVYIDEDVLGWNLVYVVLLLLLFFIIISDVISLLILFSKSSSQQQAFLMNNQSQYQQQQQQPHNYYPVTQPVQIINQENTLGTQPQPSLIPQTIENQQPNHHHQQQELPQQIYYSVPQYIPPPPQILQQQQQQQQPPNYPAGNYFYTK